MLYETMFKRKSVRKYNDKQIDENTLNSIGEYVNNLERLFPDIKTEFKIVRQDEVKATSSVKAPYYMAVFSEEKEGYLTNVGFMLEQLDLYLSSNNIGTCWTGMGSPVKELKEDSELEFVIMLAFGNSDKSVHRNDVSEFKRKEVNEISNVDNELMQTVRFAPSSMNSQPWYYNQNNNEIDIYTVKNNVFKNIISGKMNKIDIGISMCFLWQVVMQNNCGVEFKTIEGKQLKGYEYINTAIITQK